MYLSRCTKGKELSLEKDCLTLSGVVRKIFPHVKRSHMEKEREFSLKSCLRGAFFYVSLLLYADVFKQVKPVQKDSFIFNLLVCVVCGTTKIANHPFKVVIKNVQTHVLNVINSGVLPLWFIKKHPHPSISNQSHRYFDFKLHCSLVHTSFFSLNN